MTAKASRLSDAAPADAPGKPLPDRQPRSGTGARRSSCTGLTIADGVRWSERPARAPLTAQFTLAGPEVDTCPWTGLTSSEQRLVRPVHFCWSAGCTKSKLKRQRDDGTHGNNETDGNSTDQGLKLSVPSVISVCSVISLPALSLLHSRSLPLPGEGHFNFDFGHPGQQGRLKPSQVSRIVNGQAHQACLFLLHPGDHTCETGRLCPLWPRCCWP